MKLYKFIPAAALLLMASCSEDEMDRINTDHGNPPIDVINGRLMITDAITSTGFTTASGDYSYYASVYNEQIFGTGNNQFSPQQSYTREQSVVTIVRMCELLK